MKLNKEEFKQYIENVEETALIYKEWRKGQCYFNILAMYYPELANEIRDTKYDPFYADHKLNKKEIISNFLKFIKDVE